MLHKQGADSNLVSDSKLFSSPPLASSPLLGRTASVRPAQRRAVSGEVRNTDPRRWREEGKLYLRVAADIRDSHSRTPRNSKSTRILWNFPRVRAQSHATKRWLAVERPQVTRVERIGPVLFCAACGCVAANHSSDISRRGLPIKWRTARSSSIQKWRDELTCIKSQKPSRLCTSMHNSI